MAYALIFNIVSYFIITGMYTVIMPLLSQEFGTDNNTIQFTLVIYQIATVISCVLAGFYADGFGKKKSMLLATVFIFVGSVICAVAPSIEIIMVGRFLQGMGVATIYILSIAAINDLYDEKMVFKILSLMVFVSSGLFVTSVFLAGQMSYYINWQSIFIFMMFFSFALFFSSKRYLPHSLDVTTKNSLSESFSHYKTLMTNRNVLGYITLQPLIVAMTWFVMSHTTFYFQKKIGLNSSEFGIAIAIIIFSFGIGGHLGTLINSKFGRDNTIHVGLMIFLTGIGAVLFMHLYDDMWVVAIVAGLAITQMGCGMITPASVSLVFSIYPKLATYTSVLRTLMITIFSYMGSQVAAIIDESSLLSLTGALLVFWALMLGAFNLRSQSYR